MARWWSFTPLDFPAGLIHSSDWDDYEHTHILEKKAQTPYKKQVRLRHFEFLHNIKGDPIRARAEALIDSEVCTCIVSLDDERHFKLLTHSVRADGPPSSPAAWEAVGPPGSASSCEKYARWFMEFVCQNETPKEPAVDSQQFGTTPVGDVETRSSCNLDCCSGDTDFSYTQQCKEEVLQMLTESGYELREEWEDSTDLAYNAGWDKKAFEKAKVKMPLLWLEFKRARTLVGWAVIGAGLPYDVTNMIVSFALAKPLTSEELHAYRLKSWLYTAKQKTPT
eukprot:TRINITY_DN69970_c0_g1_i1.p1 TRINITY_DN69970_c0_g1~~TRINITY_DN69970_c0_g1_i1.p1  ORF type:complete len:280 (-),score=25.33 TRINITY_DN69970_c0_g1_i1:61-900(-)